jgi:hypothetical protein
MRESVEAIRAHMLSQDAEIERLIQESSQRFIRGREWAELSGRNERRAELAESRLATANALLREAIGWNWLDDGAPRPDVMDVLDQRIQAHLQGAGNE